MNFRFVYSIEPMYLLSIVFLVGVPSNFIKRHAQDVARGPLITSDYWSLRCYCTHNVDCTHVNLEITCSWMKFLSVWAPSTSRFSIKSTMVWVIPIIEVAAGRHLSIWNPVWVCHADRFTYFWRKKKSLLLRRLDTGFQGQYLQCSSIDYVAINKDLEKLPPELY